MPVIDRTLWFNGLIDDDGSGTVGTVWQKSEVGKFLDSIDAALAGQFTAAAHAASHRSGGLDAIHLDELAAPTDVVTLNASAAAHGLLPKLSGTITTFLRGDGTWASAVSLHAPTHKAGGTDPIRLDEFAAPIDVTTLDASTVTHGLLPKLPGGTTTFLRADGTFAIPTGTTPAAHAATHGAGGSDPIAIAESQVTNLATDLAAIGTNKADKTDARFTDARTPTAHAASHKSGGGDPLKLDELSPPTDVVTLNATTFNHGLLPKLPGGSTLFLRGDGTFAAPTATPGPHASTHANAGSDPVDVASLAGFPGGTSAFLRADGQFVIPPNGSAGGGNVTGPVTSVVGHLASYNNATGTLIADSGIALTAVVVTTDARLSDARTPTVHAASHAAAGSDPITIAESQVTNLVADLAGKASTTDPRLTDARTPTAHATSHKSGGTDAIKIDELGAPTDVLTLNVSTTAHGLAPKLPGNTTTFLRGDGSYATPAAAAPAAHATTHKSGGTDAIKLDELAAPTDITTLNVSTTAHGLAPKLPGNTTTFLRGDGTFAAAGGGGYTVISNTQTGTINDWAPSGMAGNTEIEWNGTADLVVTGIAGGVAGQIVTIRNGSGSAKLITFPYFSSASLAANRCNNVATSAPTPVNTGGYITFIYTGTWWQMLEHEQGNWITPPFNAADFTANGSMTWTVDAGDVRSYRYRLSGKTLHVEGIFLTTTTGGTAASALYYKIPGGFTLSGPEYTGSNFYKESSPWTMGAVWLSPTFSDRISVWKADFGGTNWPLLTNGIGVYSNVVLEIA